MILPFGGQQQQQQAPVKSVPSEQLRKIMEEEMSDVVQKCIDASPPVAQGGMNYAQNRIQAEIRRVFQPIRSEWFSDVVAQGQWEPVAAYKFLFRSKKLEDAYNRRQIDVLNRAFNTENQQDSNVVINWAGMEPRKELHQQQRGPDGQIVPNNVVYHVADKKSIDKYVAQVARSVGKMVSGWYQVLTGLGKPVKSPFPGVGKGSVSFKSEMNITQLTVENEFGDFNGILSRAAKPQELINAAARNCQRRVDEIQKGNKDPKKGLMGQPSGPVPAVNAPKMPAGLAQAAQAMTPRQSTLGRLALSPLTTPTPIQVRATQDLTRELQMANWQVWRLMRIIEQNLT